MKLTRIKVDKLFGIFDHDIKLKVNDGITIIICSKITLKKKKKTGITIPKGKDISQKEFDILVEKKNKELENVNFNK